MIYDTSNVASDTQITEFNTGTGLRGIASINTDNNCIYVYDTPIRLNYMTEGVEISEIKCQHIEINYNESGVPNKFIFKRLKDAQP